MVKNSENQSKNSLTGFLKDESATVDFAVAVAEVCVESKSPIIIYLVGDLGAGKSAFSRAFIQHFLPGHKVKSPTYTLVETYSTNLGSIQHFDLYRLCDPEELEFLGFRELIEEAFVCLIEWPSKGFGLLPEKDIGFMLTIEDFGRTVALNSMTNKGNNIVNLLEEKIGTQFVKE